ncbi:MAG TPA: hypothetical protein VFV23_14370 [Verrucomicrobiae bacterium]|nr:hypothetical protein [Verrucomicrobiae bacterium]
MNVQKQKSKVHFWSQIIFSIFLLLYGIKTIATGKAVLLGKTGWVTYFGVTADVGGITMLLFSYVGLRILIWKKKETKLSNLIFGFALASLLLFVILMFVDIFHGRFASERLH